jgi:RNA polymerase sigma factor (sigma-70 family)
MLMKGQIPSPPLPMSSAHSVSQWIADLKRRDSDAAQLLWERYAIRLVELARHRLRDIPKRMADEEDVVQSVFHSICRGAAAGRFKNVRNRDELWWLLLSVTKQKVINHIRRESALKRGAGRVQANSATNPSSEDRRLLAVDRVLSEEPMPEFIVMLEEQHNRLLGLLRDDQLRRIAVMRIEGFTVPEIADEFGVSSRSIERKLQLIRDVWTREVAP